MNHVKVHQMNRATHVSGKKFQVKTETEIKKWNGSILDHNGRNFFVFCKEIHDTIQSCVVFLGSAQESEHYQCTISVEGSNSEKVLYSGKVHALEDVEYCINFFPWKDGGGSVFVMKKEFAKKIAKNGQIDLDIEIRCLKEEAKDEDVESGVSECEE